MADPIRILTISRSFGSGGGDMARAVAAALGWRLIGHELVREVAERLQVPVEEVEVRDEQVAGLAERVGAVLADAFPEMLLPSFPVPHVDHDTVRVLVETILEEAAGTPPVVVLGPGGQVLFRDREDALHVRVDAPIGHRVRAVTERLGVSDDEARARIRHHDRERALYLRHHYDVDWADPLLYGLLVNTAAVTTDGATRALLALLRTR